MRSDKEGKQMEYRLLGSTGVWVSQLCFGTMSFGGDADEATSAAMFRRCREAGINFFDCANIYQLGRAEEILGRLMADCRDELVITTKFSSPMGEAPNQRGASRRHIMACVEASLRRLNTDRIDLYFVHGFDAVTPIESSLRALDDLVQQGKILYPAVSNFAAWQIAKALGISDKEGWARFECIQPMYNLVKRQVEVEILPLAQSEKLAVIPYSPLGAGLLTGKYGVGRQPDTGRIVHNAAYSARYAEPWMYETADRFTAFAQQNGYDPVPLAVAWVASHPAITAPIIGARNLDQLEGSLQSLGIEMTSDLRASVSALSIEPALATDRTEERQR
jgi:aryl-alcohol dehydrogenase-like predicted oxidoreductase